MEGSFRELILRAKESDPMAFTELMDMYEPLLLRESKIDGETDQDLLQELWMTMISYIQTFEL